MSSFTVAVQGQVLSVHSVVLPSGVTPIVYSDAGMSSPVTLPEMISTDTTFYLREPVAVVTIKESDGHVLFAGAVASGETVAPLPSVAQIAAAKIGQSETGSRPSAAVEGVGAVWYDTSLHKPIWSDGTDWRDGAGQTV